jgi:5-formaminoimidazole-4-carboxamide-1-(beta)-D-ribofuranosyl 5'-monophosphate synthetase
VQLPASYDPDQLTLSAVGSHSALEVAAGARAQGLRNLIIVAKGRDQTYVRHYKAEKGPYPRGCVDETLAVETFPQILEKSVQDAMLQRNAIFVPNRSFEVYLHQKYSYDEIERGMRVPFFGNRRLLRAEERDEPNNQYAIMDAAQIRYPRRFSSPKAIDGLALVKAPHKKISFERAFFLVRSPSEYERESARLIEAGIVDERGLAGAVIEEYLLGPTVNLNFFYSPVLGELELMGTDTRRQTNIDGLRDLPFAQAKALADEPIRMEEAGHIAATLTESMLEPAFDLGERIVHAARELTPPGIIGPFALQCAIVAGPPKTFVVYDVSLRIPGSPGTRYTPYSSYRWGRDVSVGERIAMEVKMAREAGSLEPVLT